MYTRVLCTAKGLRVSSPRINFVIFILFVINDMVCVSIAINAMMFPYLNSKACSCKNVKSSAAEVVLWNREVDELDQVFERWLI